MIPKKEKEVEVVFFFCGLYSFVVLFSSRHIDGCAVSSWNEQIFRNDSFIGSLMPPAGAKKRPSGVCGTELLGRFEAQCQSSPLF